MKELRTVLIEYYMSWINDYLTIEKFANDNGLTIVEARLVIQLAEKVRSHRHPEG